MNVRLFGADALRPSARARLLRGVRTALGRHAESRGEVCIIIVDDRKIRDINREFIGPDRLTDVIAFNYEKPPAKTKEAPPFGDVYIAKGVAARQAKAIGHALADELLVLAVHGALHLAGYDDHRPADRRRMFARQDRIVSGLLPKRRHGKK